MMHASTPGHYIHNWPVPHSLKLECTTAKPRVATITKEDIKLLNQISESKHLTLQFITEFYEKDSYLITMRLSTIIKTTKTVYADTIKCEWLSVSYKVICFCHSLYLLTALSLFVLVLSKFWYAWPSGSRNGPVNPH